jgi:hypothetical protein
LHPAVVHDITAVHKAETRNNNNDNFKSNVQQFSQEMSTVQKKSA